MTKQTSLTHNGPKLITALRAYGDDRFGEVWGVYQGESWHAGLKPVKQDMPFYTDALSVFNALIEEA